MPATIAHLPVYMRVGNGAERQIGTVEVRLDAESKPAVDFAGVVALLRAVADEIQERAEQGDGQPVTPPELT